MKFIGIVLISVALVVIGYKIEQVLIGRILILFGICILWVSFVFNLATQHIKEHSEQWPKKPLQSQRIVIDFPTYKLFEYSLNDEVCFSLENPTVFAQVIKCILQDKTLSQSSIRYGIIIKMPDNSNPMQFPYYTIRCNDLYANSGKNIVIELRARDIICRTHQYKKHF